MKWPSPWGEGFPGWHIECSAMSMKYLGERFDIHTGGNDNEFPHHEDEIAQSEGAVGHQVVSIWVHGGHLRLAGQKIAKSTGNVVRVPGARRARASIRSRSGWLTFQTRYRSEMDFTWEAIEDADRRRHAAPATDGRAGRRPHRARRRGEGVRRAIPRGGGRPTSISRGASSIVNELVSSDRRARRREVRAARRRGTHVLGLDLEREATSAWEPTDEMRALMAERDAARAAKDFAAADQLRDRLDAMGLEVMDTPEGTKVRPRDRR